MSRAPQAAQSAKNTFGSKGRKEVSKHANNEGRKHGKKQASKRMLRVKCEEKRTRVDSTQQIFVLACQSGKARGRLLQWAAGPIIYLKLIFFVTKEAPLASASARARTATKEGTRGRGKREQEGRGNKREEGTREEGRGNRGKGKGKRGKEKGNNGKGKGKREKVKREK